MSSDRTLCTTVTIARPSRRLLASLREAVLSAQQDPRYPERQTRELTELAIAVKGDQLELSCTFGEPTLSQE